MTLLVVHALQLGHAGASVSSCWPGNTSVSDFVPDGRVAGRFDVEPVVVDQSATERRTYRYQQGDHDRQDYDSDRCDRFGVVVVEPPGDVG